MSSEQAVTVAAPYWPTVTADLPGIGGKLRSEPAHFIVREVPLYDASGEGGHVFVCLTREGWTTPDLERHLAALFDLRPVDVGSAGLKDRHARVTQTFSLSLPAGDPAEVAQHIAAKLPVEVEWVSRHRNKLKPGHLLGNRFTIVVTDPTPDAATRAGLIAAALRTRGVPNYYGQQRFGASGENAQRGKEILLGRPERRGWLRRLLLNAWQSAAFNDWLAARLTRGWFEQVLVGDVAKKVATGGLFHVEDAAAEKPRFESGEITFTGPIYGARMMWAQGEPGQLEHAVLENESVPDGALRAAGLSGSRRTARLLLGDLEIAAHPAGLSFSFFLPKGSYATTVLREFTKSELRADGESEESTFENRGAQ